MTRLPRSMPQPLPLPRRNQKSAYEIPFLHNEMWKSAHNVELSLWFLTNKLQAQLWLIFWQNFGIRFRHLCYWFYRYLISCSWSYTYHILLLVIHYTYHFMWLAIHCTYLVMLLVIHYRYHVRLLVLHYTYHVMLLVKHVSYHVVDS